MIDRLERHKTWITDSFQGHGQTDRSGFAFICIRRPTDRLITVPRKWPFTKSCMHKYTQRRRKWRSDQEGLCSGKSDTKTSTYLKVAASPAALILFWLLGAVSRCPDEFSELLALRSTCNNYPSCKPTERQVPEELRLIKKVRRALLNKIKKNTPTHNVFEREVS